MKNEKRKMKNIKILLLSCLLLPVSLFGQNMGQVYYPSSGALSLPITISIDSSGGTSPRTITISTPGGNSVKYLDLSGGGGVTAPTTISPSQLTSDQDNYNPTGMGKATYVRLDGDSGMRAITGIADSTAGTLEKTLLNIGSYPIYFPQEHPDSDAAHRFTGWPGDYVLYPGASVKILYDVTSTKWRIIGDVNEDLKAGLHYHVPAADQTAGDHNELAFAAIGTGTFTFVASTTTVPAHWAMSTSTNAAWGYYAYFPKGGSTFGAFGASHIFTEAYVQFEDLSDGTNTYTSELQIAETTVSANLENNNMIGIRYSHGINAGKFELFSQSNTGTESVADLGVTVAADTRYKLRIEVDESRTEARAYVNGSYAGRVTGTFPNATPAGARIVHLKSLGATARVLKIHSFSAGAIYP